MFRVNPISTSYYVVSEIDPTNLELVIRLTDTMFREIKVLEGIPPNILLEYSQTLCDVQDWMRGEVAEFPIPKDQDAIALYDSFNVTPEEVEQSMQSQESRYQL